jgi:hypothetical protein
MIICFNCSPETKRQLDSLLQVGQYKDYSEVISFAVMNLAVLQEEVLKAGSVVIAKNAQAIPSSKGTRGRAKEPSATQDFGELQQMLETRTDESLVVPPIFRLDLLRDLTPPFVELPDDIWAPGQQIPLDRWIFGQFNKLLPAKVSCRGLAHLLHNQPKGVELGEAAEEIAKQAAVLGNFLARYDEQYNIGRDDAFSTAFPSNGDNSDKSRLRYANQFVASVNKQGQVSGLLIDLKLINKTGRKLARIGLTEIGWRFAVLPNPILDGVEDTPPQKFSDEERAFLLAHVARSVPIEDFAYRAILRAIMKEANTPDTIDADLLQYLTPDAAENLSKSFLSSQRSGAISRMTDLGLVERVRDGVRVSYLITDIGEKYLQNRQ